MKVYFIHNYLLTFSNQNQRLLHVHNNYFCACRKNQKALSFRQLWNMSFGFFGIQFGFALQNANVSRIFQTLGAEIDDIGYLMDCSTGYRLVGSTHYWLFKRSYLAPVLGSAKTFLFYWRYPGFHIPFHHAQFIYFADGCV